MPEWLFSRKFIIILAIIGGVISLLVSWCRSNDVLTEKQIVWLNKASYAFMGASIVLFVGVGFFID